MGYATATITVFLALVAIQFQQSAPLSAGENQSRRFRIPSGHGRSKKREVIEVGGGPDDDLVWVVQLSDLHFSVHHPERAEDFREIVGPTISFIKPALVLLTGDLTDGKSKDLLTTKQDEAEWIEYEKVIRDVVKRSGLDKSRFYDIRGNHDNFGVPAIGGPFDFFSKYSINGQLERTGKVSSITIQTGKRKILFVGFDSTMSLGLRSPTNFFGHPTDELLADINSQLTQWDSPPFRPVAKISFGHFPLSFSASSKSGKTLKDVFVESSLSAYLCGHLHVKFGKNLKRHHLRQSSNRLFQLNGHRTISKIATKNDEFWEWEVGDWRKNRAMRILAIDRGHISFVDTDFKLGARRTIILPTFPLDSRFTSSTSQSDYELCKIDPFSCGSIRVLVFSSSPLVSVFAKVYDSISGNLVVVLESPMTKLVEPNGDLYVAPWNIHAFEDPSPDRYLLQIEATDISNRSTLSEARPFSVNGISSRFSWSWKEFFVMGCQWDSLYYPLLSGFYFIVLSFLLIPKLVLSFSRRPYTYRNFRSNRGFANWFAWICTELYGVQFAWLCVVSYLFYLILCPWFYGQIFTQRGERSYMTYKGWVSRFGDSGKKIEFVGSPDVMVVVLPHLYLVVLPSIMMIVMYATECGVYRDRLLSCSSKKKEDYESRNKGLNKTSEIGISKRWFRKPLHVASLGVVWQHFKSCWAVMKAFEMNPIVDFPIYCFAVPFLLAYTVWKTRRNRNGLQEK